MSYLRISVACATVGAVVALGWCTAPAAAQDKKPDDSKIKRAIFTAQYRTVADLAGSLARQFKDIAGFQVVPDGPSNTLLLSGSPAILDEATKTLAKLDRRPQEVVVEILILRVVSQKGAEGKTEGSVVDAKDFSGPIDRVLKTINGLEKQGAIASMRRLQLKGVENQSAQLKEVASKPYTTGVIMTMGFGGGVGGFGGKGDGGFGGKGEGASGIGGKGGKGQVVPAAGGKGKSPAGKPTATRTVSYKNVGTTVFLTPMVGSDGVVSLHLKINDDRSLQPENGIPLGADENGPVIATEFISVVVEADLQVRNGMAVLARDVQMKSKLTGEQTLIVVTAQLMQ